ncbi:hypothetical protein FOA52_013780 [Chlamydomonas sp. UWO 241]|nr:hypothetical protein FOA52_013780 [Chlamydomonas sp. UWO 241]
MGHIRGVLSDRFGLLEAVPPEGADAQAEYDAMAAAIREVATNHLAPRGSRPRRGWQFTLSQRTLRLMDARQRAHTAWLRSKSAAAKRERNRANRAADAAVQRDRERWISQQVAEAQDMLRKKNLRQFARACDRLAGRSRSHQIPPAMRDVSGALHSGPDGVLKAMTESFDKLYGGETKLSDETLNQLENDVAAFELTRATEVNEAHGRPPDLAETEACVPIVTEDALVSRLIIQPPSDHKFGEAAMAHYTWGAVYNDSTHTVWSWDKRVYTDQAALAPKPIPMPPAWEEGKYHLQEFFGMMKVPQEQHETLAAMLGQMNKAIETLPDLTEKFNALLVH